MVKTRKGIFARNIGSNLAGYLDSAVVAFFLIVIYVTIAADIQGAVAIAGICLVIVPVVTLLRRFNNTIAADRIYSFTS